MLMNFIQRFQVLREAMQLEIYVCLAHAMGPLSRGREGQKRFLPAAS